jgi:hypothetical protein
MPETTIWTPAHYTQLGRGTPVPGADDGSMDCGPSVVKNGIRRLTTGDLDPTIAQIRARMGKPGAQTTNTWDAQRCVNSYDIEMRALDRRPLFYQRLHGGAWEGVLRDSAQMGFFIQWGIDYGVFNRRMDRTGDPDFTGGHSIGTHGWDRRRVRGGRHWRTVWGLYDPLDDARRPGIPDGPRWVSPGPILAAWGALGHYAGVFRGGEKTP